MQLVLVINQIQKRGGNIRWEAAYLIGAWVWSLLLDFTPTSTQRYMAVYRWWCHLMGIRRGWCKMTGFSSRPSGSPNLRCLLLMSLAPHCLHLWGSRQDTLWFHAHRWQDISLTTLASVGIRCTLHPPHPSGAKGGGGHGGHWACLDAARCMFSSCLHAWL